MILVFYVFLNCSYMFYILFGILTLSCLPLRSIWAPCAQDPGPRSDGRTARTDRTDRADRTDRRTVGRTDGGTGGCAGGWTGVRTGGRTDRRTDASDGSDGPEHQCNLDVIYE
jgi:hypothetical protein